MWGRARYLRRIGEGRSMTDGKMQTDIRAKSLVLAAFVVSVAFVAVILNYTKVAAMGEFLFGISAISRDGDLGGSGPGVGDEGNANFIRNGRWEMPASVFAPNYCGTPGGLDPSFDDDGLVNTTIGSFDVANSIAIQQDGKLVVAGYRRNGSGDSDVDFAVVRYNQNGSLDTSFDGDGKVTTSFGTGSESANAVAIQNDGKIVVAGSANNKFTVVRYNFDGSLDLSFDGDGKVQTDFGAEFATANSVAIQTDGKLVVAGIVSVGGQFDFGVVRYLANGSLDPTFGSNGRVTTAVGFLNDHANSVAVQGDGKIVVGGYSQVSAEPYTVHFSLVRYNIDGSVDPGFGKGGGVITPDQNVVNQGLSLAVQPDGKIVLAGNSGGDFAFVRYNPDGSIDQSFGTNGKAVVPNTSTVYSIAIQPDGKIVAAGTSYNGTNNDFALVRLESNGSLDPSFGNNGRVVTSVHGDDRAYAVAIQSDGRLVVAGSSWTNVNPNPGDIVLIRYFSEACGPPPQTTIVGTPPWQTNNTTATFEFVGSGNSGTPLTTFDCKIDNLEFAECTSPKTYTGLSDGEHTFIVRSRDGTGNVDSTPAVHTWTVDTVPPETVIDSGPSGVVTSNSVTFEFHGIPTGILGYKCQLDSQTPVNCHSGTISYTGTFGSHTFSVHSVDEAGNADQTPATQSWTQNPPPTPTPTPTPIPTPTPTPTPIPTPTPPFETVSDFDGDGRTDLSVVRPSNNIWYLLRATAGFTAQQYGEPGDLLAPADYDGDRNSDVAVFRPSNGTWYIFMSLSQTFQTFGWGQAGDLPVPIDRDGDGKADLVIFRPSNSTWYTRYNNGTFNVLPFGASGDKPIRGDFDGDNRGDIAVFRPISSTWYVLPSQSGYTVQTWGQQGDIPLTGDFDGDKRTDRVVFRPSTGQWYLSRSQAGFGVVNWGQAGDVPVPGDYDGDTKTDIAVFRPSNGTWYIIQSSAGFLILTFGQDGDVPTQSAFTY